MKRREFHEKVIKTASGAIAGKAAGMLGVSSEAGGPYAEPDYVLSLAQRAADLRDELGGVPIATKVISQSRSISAALPKGGKELRVSASEFSRQAAWTVYDAGRPDVALSLAGDALNLATYGPDTERQAAAHALLSDLYLQEGKPERAAYHAQEGLKLPDVSEGIRAALKAYLGWAFGQSTWAGSSKSRSQKFIDQARSQEQLSPLDQAWVHGVSGLVLHKVGENREAFMSFEDAVRITEPLPAAQYQANDLANAASVALACRDLDRAAELMGMLAYVAPLITSRWVDRKVSSVLSESARWVKVPDINLARERLMLAMPSVIEKRGQR
ncbi:tetratricopeptide repeat protein [Actinomadura terrae]|uniref:tetratricopeptide repeat protein n=1 Tax=Actinomadura terrae TaxID=604353 RepID=UPI001FA7C9E5|nr:tetratricopeptide repeat protein [Actinomadura terrae]